MDLTRLKEYRELKGLTQVQVAKALKVSLMTYRIWEMGGGAPNRVNYENLKALFLPFTDEMEKE